MQHHLFLDFFCLTRSKTEEPMIKWNQIISSIVHLFIADFMDYRWVKQPSTASRFNGDVRIMT